MARYVSFALIIAFSILAGCISFPQMSSSGKPGKYYENFFVGDGVNQYFVKPLLYKREKQKIKLDFTFRDTSFGHQRVLTNCSFYTSSRNLKVTHLGVRTDDSIYFKTASHIVIRKEKKQWEYRYTADFKYPAFRLLIGHESCKPVLLTQSKGQMTADTLVFKPTRKTQRATGQLDREDLPLIRMNAKQ